MLKNREESNHQKNWFTSYCKNKKEPTNDCSIVYVTTTFGIFNISLIVNY